MTAKAPDPMAQIEAALQAAGTELVLLAAKYELNTTELPLWAKLVELRALIRSALANKENHK